MKRSDLKYSAQENRQERSHNINNCNGYNITMRLSKRIPVTEEVWKELAEMRGAGQTYNDLLTEMIELRKKRLLVEDVAISLQEDDFLPLSETRL